MKNNAMTELGRFLNLVASALYRKRAVQRARSWYTSGELHEAYNVVTVVGEYYADELYYRYRYYCRWP